MTKEDVFPMVQCFDDLCLPFVCVCSCRFCQTDNRSQLPKWLQPHLRMYSQFGMAQRELNLFIKKAEEKVWRGDGMESDGSGVMGWRVMEGEELCM